MSRDVEPAVRSPVDSLPYGVARVAQVEGRWCVTEANAAFWTWAGSRVEGGPLEQVTDEATAAALARPLRACAERHGVVDERLELRSRWYRVVVSEAPGELVLTLLGDRAEDDVQALRLRLRQFESIAENSPDIIARLDRAFRHVYVNRAILDATGLTAADFIGKDHVELGMPPDLVERWQSTYRHVFETGQEGKKEFEFPTPSGVRSYSSRVVAERGEDGTVETVLSVARDVTALKQAVAERLELERTLHQAQRLESLGILAGGIAHDFNNLLAVILTTVSLTRLEVRGHPAVQANLDQIEGAVDRAADLCSQMLAYSGKGRFILEDVDVDRLVLDCTELLRASVPKKVRLALRLDGGLPLTRADKTQLHQVVMNLVMNATEAIGEGEGLVEVTTELVDAHDVDMTTARCAPERLEGRYVRVRVRDDGCGMAPSVLSRIFEPFFTTKFTGRGLGLAATLGILKSHRCVLHVESEPGRGTTFSVLVPVLATPAQRPAPELPAAPAARPGTVLVVDDEAAVRATVSRLLESCGFTSIEASTGHEALHIVRERSSGIDLVLLDVTMPLFDGPETLNELRRLRVDLPVVLMSGYDEAETGPVPGAPAPFVRKPFTRDRLLGALDAARAAPPRTA